MLVWIMKPEQLQRAVEGRYRLIQQLVGGGMSTVYLAHDDALDRRVVIKVLAGDLASTEGKERFRQEIALVATLSHPQVVPVLAAGDVDGLPYFVMPFVDGESLRRRLGRGPLSVRETVSILVDVARALAAAHERGIVHRDIKPDNILLTAQSAVVTDFGVAKVRWGARRSRAAGSVQTSEGTSLGTPAYMAPEQIAGGSDVDGRADLYAVGIVAYEMIAGAPPFTDKTPRKVLAAHLVEAPPALSRRRRDVPPGLASLILRCLAKDPADRPRTALDIVRALQDPETIAVPRARVGTLAVRGALRGLRRAPMLSVYAVACLALGTGATIAVCGAIDHALLRDLPFAHARALVTVYRTTPQFKDGPFSAPNYMDLARSVHQISDLAAIGLAPGVLGLPNDPVQVRVSRASGNLFSALGIRAASGRLFDRRDVENGGGVAVVTDELWRSRFGGDPSIVGRSIELDGRATTIVGVLPPEFRIPRAGIEIESDIWIPLVFTPTELALRRSNSLMLLGQLAPGSSVRVAERELRDRLADIVRTYPDQRDESIRVTLLHADSAGAIRTPLLLLLGAVGLVLVVATANVVCLLLARGLRREQEFAIRSALGASRWAVVRPVVAESAILACAGVLLGTGLAAVGLRLAGAGIADNLPQLGGLAIGVRIIPFALAIAVLITVLGGALPAWYATRVGAHEVLRGIRGSSSSRSRVRSLNALVVAEVALALVLTIATGLLFKSVTRLIERDPGFDPAPVLTLTVAVPVPTYPDGTAVQRFLAPVLDAVGRLPGIAAVGATSMLPFHCCRNSNIRYEGRPNDIPTRMPLVEFRNVTPGYFAVTRQRVISGRLLRDADAPVPASVVVVVNEALAQRDFAGQDPVGKRFYTSDTTFATIVGEVSTIRNTDPIAPPVPEMYVPYQPGSQTFAFNLMVRVARGDPRLAGTAVTAAIRAVDPRAAVTRVMPMRDLIRNSVRRQRFFLAAIGLFAVVAVVLAIAGLHGLLSFTVAQRAQEIGIRSALGSSPLRTLATTVRRGLHLIGGGVLFGIAGAMLIVRLLQATIAGIEPLDLGTWLVATIALVATGLLACLPPSWRAASIAPASAMRGE
jgi:putative ABC transport system permease protein